VPRLLLDPTAAEESTAAAVTTMALMPSAGLVAYTEHSGVAAPSVVGDAMTLALEGCACLAAVMRAALAEAFTKRVTDASKAAARRSKAPPA
jgi:ribonuclease PH